MSEYSVEWTTKCPSINYLTRNLPKTQVEDYPLKAITVTERIPRRLLSSQSSTGRTTPVNSTPTSLIDISAALEGIDPLTKFAIEEVDPLTAIAYENAKTPLTGPSKSDKSVIDSWDSRKVSILNQFTTSEKISIVTSFLNDDEQVVVKAQSSSIDRVQSKLEQLDYFEEGSQKKFDLSQVEYIKRIDLLNKELVSAWTHEQRVKSLKIAIQCAKMLSDTEVLQFYPSKFVLITEILDVFGLLVYERLKSKAFYIRPGTKTPTALPQNFTPDMVHETAKETCRNWFYKIASIRELVPRIYVEMAILKSYSFLTSSEYSAALMRLTHMIRGIGNPLVSLYARCYLCRVGLTVTTPGKDNSFLLENFHDFLNLHQHLLSPSVLIDLNRKKMPVASYLTLYTPGLDFILSQVATQGGENLLQDILERCKSISNSSLMLNTIMSVFKPSLISHRCLNFLDTIIKTNDDRGFPLHVLLRTLGLCITVCPPPTEDRKKVLAIAWNHLSRIGKIDEYLNCVEPWVQYAVQHFMSGDGDINLVLSDIVQHMTAECNEKPYNQLKLVVERIVNNVADIEALVAMDCFLPLIDVFQHEAHKVDVCKIILKAWNAPQQSQSIITDPIIINTISHICSALHDSVNALTVEDEVRQISELISAIIRKVDYGRDFEQQLTFYVESRGAFSNLDSVLVQLVHCVNLLSIKTRAIVNGHHTRKTGAFVRACAAYCFITIPSIASAKTRLELYLHSGQVALFNSCLGQADSFFKAALTLLHEVNAADVGFLSKNSDDVLLAYVRKFLSILVVVPDSPDKGVLHLTRILLNFIQNHDWQSTQMLADVYINVLDMLAVMGQDVYPYYVDKVKSNDSLYGSDPKFIAELNKIASIVLNELLIKLKEIGAGRTQSLLSQKLINVILSKTDLTASQTLATLVVNLWNISLKHGNMDKKRMGLLPSKKYLARKYANDDEIYNLVLSKLSL